MIMTGCVAALSYMSCKKEKEQGIATVIKGHVEDSIRGINLSGYKIVLVKKVGTECAGWECGTVFEKTASAYTDSNGNYLLRFNYKLKPGQAYYIEEQYYGIPYYHESSSNYGAIIAGDTNIINMNAWKPIELKLNIRVLNNDHPPLMIGNELAGNPYPFLNVENIYQQSINETYILRSRPNSDINIIFYYNINYNSPTPTVHKKTIPYHTSLDSVATLNYTIDCSTF